MVEAPVWQGAAYNGYDYAALSEPADKLVVRVADYGDVSEDFPIAPLAPLEEVYYALAELADQVDSDCLSLLLTTTGSAWTDGRHTGQASAAEIEQLLSASQTKDYYSDRYACAYLTSGGRDTAVWYLNGEAALGRPGWLLSSAWTSCASATCPLWRTMTITICWRGWTPDPPRCKSET